MGVADEGETGSGVDVVAGAAEAVEGLTVVGDLVVEGVVVARGVREAGRRSTRITADVGVDEGGIGVRV